jgi:hypothetical protein
MIILIGVLQWIIYQRDQEKAKDESTDLRRKRLQKRAEREAMQREQEDGEGS